MPRLNLLAVTHGGAIFIDAFLKLLQYGPWAALAELRLILHTGRFDLNPSDLPWPLRSKGFSHRTWCRLITRGEIHEAELRRYIDWLIDHGVHGLYPNGSTGEFTRFTPEERRRIIEIVCDQTRGRVPVLAGAAEANVCETIKACEAYYACGARAVAIVSPFYYKLSPDSGYAYFREIALNSPDRCHTVQHPDVRQPYRCADDSSAGRV